MVWRRGLSLYNIIIEISEKRWKQSGEKLLRSLTREPSCWEAKMILHHIMWHMSQNLESGWCRELLTGWWGAWQLWGQSPPSARNAGFGQPWTYRGRHFYLGTHHRWWGMCILSGKDTYQIVSFCAQNKTYKTPNRIINNTTTENSDNSNNLITWSADVLERGGFFRISVGRIRVSRERRE